MTPEEKHEQMLKRNASIVAYYEAGHKLSQCASHFKLGRQHVLKILKTAGVWKPYTPTNRTKFVGVTVTENVKEALKDAAEKQGVSVSQFASNALEAALGKSDA